MKRIRKNRGITLISLVVTIIVLLILAGITINMLFGENGLLNRATEATEEYSKSEAREKVELLLSEYTIEKATGENTDFAKFLRKNLQVGVAQNEDDTYSFMLGEWQVVATENEVISIEKFKLDVDKTYPNVASMRADTELTDGQLVQTESYWDKQYGGSAYYDIVSSISLTVDDGKCIQLDNGLYAELHPINDTVTVNQFGAYGDGEHDDAKAIQTAINSGYGNVAFESPLYKQNKDIQIYVSDIAILGNNATLFTDEQYEGSIYYAVVINSHIPNGTNTNSDMLYNIMMQNLNLESREITTKHRIQMRVYNVTNLELSNCNFNIPEIENNKERGITNLWIYTGCHDVLINQCSFINNTFASEEAGGVWITEMKEDGNTTNIKFTNNYLSKSGHDEILAVWGYNIKDVFINNNEIYADDRNVDNPSDKNILLGNSTSKISNIIFSENTIETNSDGQVITCNSGEKNGIIIRNNNFKHSIIEPLWSDNIFNNNNIIDSVVLENNYIEYNAIQSGDKLYGIANNLILNDNEIIINSDVGMISNSLNKFYNNDIKIIGNVEQLTRNVSVFDNNMINITCNKIPSNIFSFTNSEINNDISISGNKFNFNVVEELNRSMSTFFRINNTKLNNNILKFINNEINVNKSNFEKQVILEYSNNVETNSQTIYLYGNTSELYTNTVINDNVCNPIIKTDNNE